MLSPIIYLMMNSLFFTLRVSGGGGGSFPRPLKAAEEREYLERWAKGNLEARNILVERNLRLVAHIVKKYYAQSGDQDDLLSIGTIGLIKGISTFKMDKNPYSLYEHGDWGRCAISFGCGGQALQIIRCTNH